MSIGLYAHVDQEFDKTYKIGKFPNKFLWLLSNVMFYYKTQ